MNQYIYDGPVKEFDKIITSRWQSSTCAMSEDRARSNLSYQFKVANKKTKTTKIILPGKIILIQKEGEL
jgi:hypothetical protein